MSELYKKDYGEFVGKTKGYNGFRNKLRLRTFSGLIKPQRGEVVLEIGVNTGLLYKAIKPLVAEAYGIDINDDEIKKLNDSKLTVMAAEKMNFSENTFDKIYAFEVIEHIKDIGRAFREISRVLKPEGLFIASFPVEIVRGQAAILDAISVYKDIRYARKLHVHKLSPRKIEKFIEDLPLKIVYSKIKFIPFPSYVIKIKKCMIDAKL